MFSIIVAYMLFIGITITAICLLIDGFWPRTELEETVRKIEHARNGYTPGYSWVKLGILFAVWFTSGYYIWG